MAEIKNNFLGAKMNQDIDDRLLSPNEYRYALNLEINRSENSDVGTLQNVLGNSLTINFNTLTGSTGLECIGAYSDNSSDDIYIFLTNNNNSTYNKDAKNFIYVYNSSSNSTTLLTKGAYLNFSTLNRVIGINLLEDLLFWTDNRNQPRRLNVRKAKTSLTYYQYEEQISVAKISPLNTMELFRLSTVPTVPAGTYETSMLDVVSQKLPNNTTANPYYNSTYAGDPAYLEDKYIRFSYRYKFEDGEYSIMAPFTQITYIPKQDGYFMYDAPLVVGGEPVRDDETSAYRSTVVDFMKNKVNNIFLQIKLPCEANLMSSKYKISFIEILYKDANDLSVNVVDSISVDPNNNGVFSTSVLVYSYNYQSKKPFKTLPERELIRVYDKTPVKALGQEVISNRIVYSNYQDKFSFPKYLDYNVGFGTKYAFGFDNGEGTSIIEYPNHTVKQNRNYQVGIVLCDKFGRESGVISSNKTTSESSGTFVASSLYAPYLEDGDIVPSEWPGNSLKVLFNNIITPIGPDPISGWPGLYNGTVTDPLYNPLGWYSYKIVVKQTEQEYYNVYVPGTMASYPVDNTTELGKTSHTVLINDNINKVPRDLTEVGPTQLQFRSSVILYPRVNNNELAYKNQMFYPGTSYSIVSTIATNDSLFYASGLPSTGLPDSFDNFYQIDSNPLIARISTPTKLGVQASETTINVVNLAVYETKPVESRLDIYWETSSVGLISELNYEIQNGAEFTVSNIVGWDFVLSEADVPGTITSGPFYFTNIADAIIVPNSVTLVSAKNVYGDSVSSSFTLEPVPGQTVGNVIYWRIKTSATAYFYYGANPSQFNSYVFNIKATDGSPEVFNNFILNGVLTNVQPSINTHPTSITKQTGDLTVYDFDGVNGSNASGGKSTEGLTWSVTGSTYFTINPTTGVLSTSNSSFAGTFNLVIRLTEASGSFVTSNFTVIYPPIVYITFTNVVSASSSGVWNGVVEAVGQTYYIYASTRRYSGTGVVRSTFDKTTPPAYVVQSNNSTGGSEILSTTYVTVPAGASYNYSFTAYFDAGTTGSSGIYVSNVIL